MSIPLPPLPRPDAVTEIYTGHGYKDVWTAATVRARDQEIVRCVLQAAAKMCHDICATRYGEYKGRKPNPNGLRAYDPYLDGMADGASECEDAIRALEFTHHE